ETDVAGAEVERARLTGRAEHAHACLALDVILPFVGVGMPMQLPHSAGVDLDQGRGDGGDGEIAGIGYPHRSALGLDGCCAMSRWLKLCGTAVAPEIL